VQVQVFWWRLRDPDGTGVRDYIHVMDLANAHVHALAYLRRHEQGLVVNLGTGRGYSVLEIIEAFSRASGQEIHTTSPIGARVIADACYADPSLAEALLGWRASRGLDEICTDAWRWQLHLREH
jgi:UDP-glucose 4-epimerase